MSKTDKTNPSFVKAARGENATIDHDHINGICDPEIKIWGGPRQMVSKREWRTDWHACGIHINAYGWPGAKEWPRVKSVRYRSKKAHRIARRQAKRDLRAGAEPEPLRPRGNEVYWAKW